MTGPGVRKRDGTVRFREARELRRRRSPGRMAAEEAESVKRREGLAKLTGTEPYVDDLALDDALWGMTVRSPAPRGRIREVRFGDGVDWSEVVVVDHRDLPGPNEVKHIEVDQPILACERVRHVHEPVLLVAHPLCTVPAPAATAA